MRNITCLADRISHLFGVRAAPFGATFGRPPSGLPGSAGNILFWLACIVPLLLVMLAAPGAEAARYAITITDGATFEMPATLHTFRTMNRRPETNNGVNPIDVAIITRGSPLVGVRGALWFQTNTSLCRLVHCTTGASNIDVAFVRAKKKKTQVTIKVDELHARLNVFNIYNLTSGIAAQIHNVLAGKVKIRFKNNGRKVKGKIRLEGSSGFAGPFPTSQYFASFTGRLVKR